MDSLPDEMVLYIIQVMLGRLELEDWKRRSSNRFPRLFGKEKRPLGILAQVCRRFRTLADHESLWEDLELQVRCEEDLSFFAGGRLTRRLESIRELWISVEEEEGEDPVESAGWFDDAVIKTLEDNWPHLESLTLWFTERDLWYCKDKGVCNINLHLPKLSHLSIHGAQQLESIYLACPKLESLSINGVCKSLHSISFQRNSALPLQKVSLEDTLIKDELLDRLLQVVGQSITALTLGSSNGYGTEDTLKEMMEEAYFTVDNLVPVSRHTCTLIARNVPNLERLIVRGNELVPLAFHFKDLAPLAQSCPKLKELVIGDNSLKRGTFSELVRNADRHGGEPTYWAAAKGARFSSLVNFRMAGSSPHAYALLSLPAMCPNLEEVEIIRPIDQVSPLPWMFDSSVRSPFESSLKEHCPKLRRFINTRLRFVASARAEPGKNIVGQISDDEKEDEDFLQRGFILTWPGV